MNFVKNETLKMRILSKNEILKMGFFFFDKLRGFAPVCIWDFSVISVHSAVHVLRYIFELVFYYWTLGRSARQFGRIYLKAIMILLRRPQ